MRPVRPSFFHISIFILAISNLFLSLVSQTSPINFPEDRSTISQCIQHLQHFRNILDTATRVLHQFLQTHTPASAYFVHVIGRHRFEASCQIPVTTFPEASRCSITFNFPPAIGYQRKPTTVTVFFFFFFSRAVLWNSSPEGGVSYVKFPVSFTCTPLHAPLVRFKANISGWQGEPSPAKDSPWITWFDEMAARYLQDRSHFRALLAKDQRGHSVCPFQLSRSSDIDSSTVQKSNRSTLKFL